MKQHSTENPYSQAEAEEKEEHDKDDDQTGGGGEVLQLANEAAPATRDVDAPPPAKEEAEPFDPRIILYVSLPAVVLGAQLFFTFSRAALTGDAVGPAVMDLLL